MSILADLEKQLADNLNRVSALIQQMENHGTLEQSLDGAGQGLKEAGERVASLTDSTLECVEMLSSVLASLQEAVGILKRGDPAHVTQALAEIKTRLDEIHLESGQAMEQTRKQIVEQQSGIADQLQLTDGEFRRSIDLATERATQAHYLAMEHFSQRLGGFSIVSLVLLVALLGLEAFQYL